MSKTISIGGVTCNYPLCGREWETGVGEERTPRGYPLFTLLTAPNLTPCNASWTISVTWVERNDMLGFASFSLSRALVEQMSRCLLIAQCVAG